MSSPLRAETFLRELQGAVSSRRLYAPNHPRNIEILDRLEGHVAALTASRPEFSALSDADRLITDDGLVESHAPVARGIFRALNQRGFDRLTVSRGVTRAELSAFIETIATLESGGAAPLTPTPHVVFSRLVRKGGPGTGSGTGAGGWGGFVSGGGAPLERVWLSIETGPIELDVLEGLVLALEPDRGAQPRRADSARQAAVARRLHGHAHHQRRGAVDGAGVGARLQRRVRPRFRDRGAAARRRQAEGAAGRPELADQADRSRRSC